MSTGKKKGEMRGKLFSRKMCAFFKKKAHTMVSSRLSAGTSESSWMPTSEPLEVSRFKTATETAPRSFVQRLWAPPWAWEARYASSAFSWANRSLGCMCVCKCVCVYVCVCVW